jgi:hypothetical protein
MTKPVQEGVVSIRGKSYQTVALRIQTFREKVPNWSMTTEILHRDIDCVVLKATISDETGRVIATGHAEEYRKTSEINRTSALENCETSAIGRALAALGLGGTEFASADEVARAITGQKGDPTLKHSPLAGAGDSLTDDKRAELDEVALYMIESHQLGKDLDAVRVYYALTDNDEKTYVWRQLAAESKLRALVKANSPHKETA